MPVSVQVRMSHLFDSLPFEILCSHEFFGKVDVMDYSVRFGPLPERTDVFFSHSPSLSRLSPFLRYQPPVKVPVIAPFW